MRSRSTKLHHQSDAGQSDRILVRSTIALAHDLGLPVVAEGIEAPACLGLLGAMQCDVGQGWTIGRPVTIAEFDTVVAAGLTRAA